ncbi:MAG: diacylglycerol kinase family protein [Burkholderiaceae bacterium]
MPRIFVLLNAGSGRGHDETLTHDVHDLFVSAGMPAEVCLVRGGEELAARIANAISRHADVVVAGGGDGTVSTVAAMLVGGDIALGILPLGTLNHFAKDLGVPLELDAAVRQIAAGRRTRVDVGEVNGRIFVNNSSLGLYPDIVHERERQRKRIGRGKWLALLWATVTALRRYPFLSVCLSVEGRAYRRRTPFVFIGNNQYRIDGFAMGERESLTGGHLSLYATQRAGRLRLVQLALRSLVGQLKQARDFDVLLATEIVIESRHHQLRVATDGETTVMRPPLTYRIRPASLTVLGAASPGQPDR